jgi:MOSC domain-containing protein YiiM/GNAT superfamily N-acetyltransferase
MDGPAEPAPRPAGRVLQVSISPGGVPKLPVERAWVGPLGLAGDAHRGDRVHGGPHRAVALFAIEAIRRVEAEGHPIFPGSCGENLTTEGIEWSTLPIGTRVAIGERLILELSAPDDPCSTIAGSFSDGRFGRISILTNPTDSRMYARVIAEGEVRPGDAIRLLDPSPDSRAVELALHARADAARRKYWVANWRAAEAAGLDLRIDDDGELAICAAPAFAGPATNQAIGLQLLPNLLPMALRFFEEHGVEGWLQLDPDDVPGAVPAEDRHDVAIFAAEPDRVVADAADGLTIRTLAPTEAASWAELLLAADPPGHPDDPHAERLRAMGPHLLGSSAQAPRRLYLAELDGEPVAVAAMFVHRKVGWLAAAAVAEGARGRGIQRALIAHRAADAAALGCDLVALDAAPDEISADNARRSGFVEIARTVLLPAAALSRS